MATELTILEQVVATASGFLIKPLYMLLMAGIVAYLWRCPEPDLRRVRDGMAVFLLGEIFCASNFVAAGGTSVVLDWLHGFGMVMGTGLICLGLISLVDERLLFFSDPEKKCSLVRFCRVCGKKAGGACRFERLCMFIALVMAVLCFMPLPSPYIPIYGTVVVFGTAVCQSYPELLQVFQMRIYPAVAAVLFAASFVMLLPRGARGVSRAKYPFALATGFFSYSMFMYVLLECYHERMVWSDFWEEVTELMLTLGIIIFLRTFKDTNGAAAAVPAEEEKT